VELTKSFKNIKKDVSELIILFGEDNITTIDRK